MIRELFEKDRPVFVRFEKDRFRVGRRRRDQLRGVITDLFPTRKRFEQERLVCYSNDGIRGKHGQRCALCRERWSCAERVRLMLLLEGIEGQPIPAILEIGHGSFDALERFVQEVGMDNVAHCTVLIGIERTEGHLRFTFQNAD